MDIEFHYWITGYIALKAGFSSEEAKTIAYASELVDDNDTGVKVKDRHSEEVYINFISQTMNILKPKKKLMRIYPIFHFVPGDPAAITARRKDGKMHILNTTPNSPNANTLLEAAFSSDEEMRLYRIGIASHTYVDTWAHQNFVGWYDYVNNIGLDPKPDIGHADAEHHPDWVCHKWEDNRLVKSVVDNRERFTEAAKCLYLQYCSYLAQQGREDKSGEWRNIESSLITIQGRPYSGDFIRYKDERIQEYKNRLDNWPDFDENIWFDEAIDTEVHGLKDSHEGLTSVLTIFKDEYFWKEGIQKENTNWYKFQESVKAQEALGIELLSPLFRQMGYDLVDEKYS
ncbi:DUF6765 family protein [Vibrio salinus]|uniref:DUF6765 family protein n=1 Tax=Vibrio salinus TaxID=2899784 RepID=UPI001E5C22DC|nr:DUF6765 family protein [Vibrio salinus]MCE0492733.1 hypothetical protein [Vibrio salinus]